MKVRTEEVTKLRGELAHADRATLSHQVRCIPLNFKEPIEPLLNFKEPIESRRRPLRALALHREAAGAAGALRGAVRPGARRLARHHGAAASGAEGAPREGCVPMPGFPLARGSAWAGGRDHTPSRVPQRWGFHQLSRRSSTYTTRPAGYPSGGGATSCRDTAPLTPHAQPGTPAVGCHQLPRHSSTYTTRPAEYPSVGGATSCREAAPCTHVPRFRCAGEAAQHSAVPPGDGPRVSGRVAGTRLLGVPRHSRALGCHQLSRRSSTLSLASLSPTPLMVRPVSKGGAAFFRSFGIVRRVGARTGVLAGRVDMPTAVWGL
jgi:hypothetical protein